MPGNIFTRGFDLLWCFCLMGWCMVRNLVQGEHRTRYNKNHDTKAN